MIICHSKRFIFIHIHKAGGTSVELALEPFLSWSDLILGSSPFGERAAAHYDARFGLGKHGSVADVERVCGEAIVRDYVVFATVREPLDRLCSLYNYAGSKVHDWAARQRVAPEAAAAQITPEAVAQAPSLGWPASRAFIEAADFSHFIRDERLAADPGFRSQAACLRARNDGAIRARFFRLEESEAWLPPLRQMLGLDFALPHANRSRLRLIGRDQVSAEDRRHVEARFAEDYAAFGYAAPAVPAPRDG